MGEAASKILNENTSDDTWLSRTGASRPAELRGGTKQVLIEEMPMTGGGGRKPGKESYPFSILATSRVESGAIVGPSFFIPESDSPKKLIATARKRHKPSGAIFLTRRMVGESGGRQVPGIRVWRGPNEAV